MNEILDGDADDEGTQQAALGRYVIGRRLGAGGMGVVYQAEDPELGRTVAIKVLRRDLSDRDRERLQREATALARLSHPNVVHVYEIDRVDGRMFIAMEFVRGTTLDRWSTEPRTWRECVRVYAQAAEGLAAAHAAGLVHRDFKPSNCILGDDGRVRVLDFGIALEAGQRAESVVSGIGVERERLGVPSSGPVSRLTVTGSVVGTLGYMAPEQFSGEGVGAASDQFSFCVSLYEALYGERPFLGSSAATLTASMLLGRIKPGRKDQAGPRALRRIVVRGLHMDVEGRWPSMKALSTELSKLLEPWRRRASVLLGAGMLAGLGGGVLTIHASEDSPCSNPQGALEGVWSDDDRSSLLAAFERHAPGDERSVRRVFEQLDDYSGAWIQMYEDSCRATYIGRQQSEQLYDQRMRCLQRRRNRLRSAIDSMASTETRQQFVRHMIAPFKLPTLGPCADLDFLMAELPLPDDDEGRRRATALRRQIDEVVTLHDVGDFSRGLEMSDEMLASAEELDYQPLLAEVLENRGKLLLGSGRPAEAEDAFERAIRVGAVAHEDRAVAVAWSLLIFAKVQQGDLDGGLSLELSAHAASDRLDDEVVRSWLFNSLGYLHTQREEYGTALEYLRSSQALKTRVLGADHVDVGISWLNLGNALMASGANERAERSFARAREIFEKTIGPAHPLSHFSVKGLGKVFVAQGRAAEAVEAFEAARTDFESAPPGWMADASFWLAQAKWLAGSSEAALTLAREVQAELDPNTPLAEDVARWLENPDAYEPNSIP